MFSSERNEIVPLYLYYYVSLKLGNKEYQAAFLFDRVSETPTSTRWLALLTASTRSVRVERLGV